MDRESDATMPRGVMSEPETLVWLPGLVTDTVLVMVQVNEVLAEYPASSVTETVTG